MWLRHVLPGIAWALLILALCISPGEELPDPAIWNILAFDKLAHALFFAVLVYLLATGFRKQYRSYKLRYYAKRAALYIGLTYGLLIELLQLLFFTYRQGEWMDMVANTIGCFAGLLLFRLVYGAELSR